MDLTLTSPVQFIPRVGPRMASLLRKLGINTVYDLLSYVPFRYDDYSLISPVARVQPGETVTVKGRLEYIRTFVTKHGKRLVMGRISDESGSLDVVWFNQMYLVKVLKPGDQLQLSGKVDWFGTKIVLTSPVYELLDAESSLHTGRLVPVYAETAGLTSKWLRGRIHYVITQCLDAMEERLPEDLIRAEHLMELSEAIRTVHFPPDQQAASEARYRLAFEELFLLILRAQEYRRRWKDLHTAYPLRVHRAAIKRFTEALPFTLTTDQSVAISDILADIAADTPMNRLLEGDVGSGKTAVAAGAIYAAAVNGTGSVLMAPTQILAEQHYETLHTILSPLGVRVGLVTGARKDKGKFDVLVGTHAVLTADAMPKNISLVVIDEQQRFGVNQRAALHATGGNGRTPHQLTMTATPIPRTLAQTVFSDLDLSALTTMPGGRKTTKTWLVPSEKRKAAYAWIDRELSDSGMQAFVVCPLIDESESMTAVRAATAEFTRLTGVFPSKKVGLLHGRMKSAEKAAVLSDFRNRRYDLLVTTPVVEVGIDIPGASIIVIEAAERFGLSQLHQLRGRVGRNDRPSYCLLFTEAGEETALARLKALETIHNGPELAELDLTLRGPGELLGTRQHGVPGLTLASLSDTAMVSRAKKAATDLLGRDPTLTSFPHLREIVRNSTIPDTAQA